MIKELNHIGIAVRNIDESLKLYSTIFQPLEIHRERVEDQKVDIASFRVGNVLMELTAPLSDDSPISKFLEKRGEGIHHLSFESTEIRNDLNRLKADGIDLINDEPRVGAHDMSIAFLHPKSTGGILLELCEPKSKPTS